MVKINCDASIEISSDSAAIAAIIRNYSGIIIGGDLKKIHFFSVNEAEAEAFRFDISCGCTGGFHNIIVESDNAGLIDRLRSKTFSIWNSAAIGKDILSSLGYFEFCFFSFVGRECNVAVDWVAKITRYNSCPSDWVVKPPQLSRLCCNLVCVMNAVLVLKKRIYISKWTWERWLSVWVLEI
ncbi:hypothetical protein GQ457_10G015010 [Hibiscus cannabinus]